MLLAASLPLSYAFMSISQGLLLLNWILEGNFKARFSKIAHSKSLLLICAFYVIHIIGMTYTSDLEWGFHDLHIKLPLLLLPLLIATSDPLDKKQLKLLMQVFIGAVIVASFIVSSIIFRIYDRPWTDIRETSIFISHIRFGLLITIAIFSAIYYALHAEVQKERFVYGIVAVWLFIFLILLQALTGLVAFLVTLIVLFFVFKNKAPYSNFKWSISIFLISFIFISVGYVAYSACRFCSVKPVSATLPTKTVNGNLYWNDLSCNFVENGNKVNVLICEQELRNEWNKKSQIKYDSLDFKKQAVKSTLVRYLASKGFTKDSVGISMLSSTDVKNIEHGIANYIFNEKGLYPKLYSVFWEIKVFDFNGDPSGHSVTQRVIFLNTALEILRDNFWFGVGTGDIKQAFHDQYIKDNTRLSMDFRHRAHNQILTFAVTFGVPFALVILAMFILVPYWEKKYTYYFFLVVFCVSMLSFLNEDTLETHPGISFVAFFYSLFLFGVKRDENDKD